jgi:hypothetical protein
MAVLLLLLHVPFNLVLALKENAESSTENVDPFHVTSRLDRFRVLTYRFVLTKLVPHFSQ